ncbi:hypothetical protein BLS_008369 [Venturia inaequalis]|uniref:Uncharacterized protein n=1 Tax=Venturia inaequalis TaxID=5025 RepID=A0A8H3YND2_VENIN|nr:hypothetical protein BLS_008369 [Venturia inaequalis]
MESGQFFPEAVWEKHNVGHPQKWVLQSILDCERQSHKRSREERAEFERYEHEMSTNPKQHLTLAGEDDMILDCSFPSLKEFQSETKQRSTSIVTIWKQLNQVLLAHEATIRNRWSKKSALKKKGILIEAFPQMAKEHNLAFKDLMANKAEPGTCGELNCSSKHCSNVHIAREAALWPYINLEDLSTPKTLLLLLNARGRNHPQHFVYEDGATAASAIEMRALLEPYLHQYYVHFSDHHSLEYATLEPIDRMTCGLDRELLRGMQPGPGLIVLEIQEKTLSFLLKVCELVLHDINGLSLSAAHIPAQTDPHLLVAMPNQSTKEQVSLRIISAEAPYQAPRRPDLRLLLAMASARAEAAKEHFWALREDPGYYLEQIEFSRVHRGRGHQPLTNWEEAITNTLEAALIQIGLWELVQTCIQHALFFDIVVKIGSAVPDPQDLPDFYLKSLVAVLNVLETASMRFRSSLSTGVYNSPKIAELWANKSYKRQQKLVPKNVNSKDLLAQLLSGLSSGSPIPLHRVTHHIERVVEAEPGQKDRLTPYVWESLADVEAIEEISRQFRQLCPKLAYPWYGGNLHQSKHRKKSADEDVNLEIREMLQPVVNALGSANLTKYGSPIGGAFNYPAEKRSTASHVAQMQSAERRLDALWSHIDATVKEKTGLSLALGEVIPGLNFSDRELQRTSDWEPPIRDEVSFSPTGLIEPSFLFGGQHTEDIGLVRYVLSTTKEKVKTRGINAQVEELALEEQEAPAIDRATTEATTVIKLKARDLKVFQTLFHQPSQEAVTLGQVKWLDFVHAMASSGFEYQSVGGSAWQFVSSSGLRAINFHEPHPDHKLRFTVARCMGRRLSRAYGWSSETFILYE